MLQNVSSQKQPAGKLYFEQRCASAGSGDATRVYTLCKLHDYQLQSRAMQHSVQELAGFWVQRTSMIPAVPPATTFFHNG
jgi:hypothetical protein